MRKVGSLKRLSRAAVLAGVAAVLVGVPLAASANPNISGFELDGNAASGGGADWNSLGSPLDFTGFLPDGTDDSDIGYGAGSNKDIDDVSTWSWKKDDVTPNKDDIVSAYASVYAEQNNLILYFGQTRLLDKNGDANVGFWFLQNPAGLNDDGSFSGSHANGDILVQSEFTNGGSVSGVHIFRWQSGSLQLISNQAECSGGKLGTADACAIVNTSTISTSWAGDVTAPYFFEGGLNLSALFPQGAPCFSTFLTNTRTSQSETAELKDFAFGDIDTCGSITVRKVTTPSGGGPFQFTASGQGLSNFDLSGGGEKVFSKLQPGSYSVAESGLPNSSWGLDNVVCTASGPGTSTNAGTPQPGPGVNITLGFLGNVVCTYTNKRQPLLTLVKSVVNNNGGTVQPSSWALSASGTSGSFSGTANSPAVTSQVVTAGVQYALAESGGPATYSASDWVCTGGGSFAGPNKITLAMGEDVTCTITNDDRAPSLTLVKQVVNNNGGTAVPGDFTLTASGPTSISGAGGASSGASFSAGTYALSETSVAGYSASAWSCVGSGTQNGASITLGLGQSATCTITNDDQPASLTVVKQLVNDNGGTKQNTSFSFDVSGPTASSNTFFDADGSVTLPVNAGTYTVTEDQAGQDGYTTTYSNCANVVIAPGGSATCTITNNDQPATLIVKKVVVNDNGGTKVASDFSFQVNAGSAQGFEADGQNDLTVNAGTYNVVEPAVAGYATTYQGCSNILLPLGGSATCTITNNDQPATLIVKKVVVNDNGGTKVASDFSYQVNGGAPRSFEADGQNDLTVNAGTYNVVEPAVDGYATTYQGCSNIVLPLGGSATCTITNDDVAAKLIVIKHVVNDNGGTKAAGDFTITVDDAGSNPPSFPGAEAPGTQIGIDPGAYSVSESGAAGYSMTQSAECSGTIALGETRTCTITNNDQPATLIVKKVVVNDNGGTKVASDFSFQVNAGSAQGFEADGQNDLTVPAGTYNVSEPAAAGYTTTYQGCANVVLALGGTATCTVTNNDVPRGQGSISVSKSANPTSLKEPGGQVTFSVTITNTSADVDVSITNVVDDKFGDLDDNGGNGCFDVPVNLAPGQKVNCTFSRSIAGAGGTSHVNVVTVTGVDENGHTLTASDDARVDITPRLIDLVIVKTASSPTPLNGIVSYSLTVTNKGPDTATNVQVADPAPAGIEYLTANPSQGTCNLGASLITCDLGSIAAGQTVTVAITARATTVGSHTNTATVTGGGGRETNPADNVDSAVTIVPAPLKPPVVQPKPTPSAQVCLSLTVSPKMTKADGKPDKVTAKVTAGAKRVKGAKVSISGAGVKKTGRTNGKGVAVVRINPKKPGIITVTVVETNQNICGPKRIGVVGVFLPPLTG
jgi:uncharacterized repeat protein (TIGR01451 family)